MIGKLKKKKEKKTFELLKTTVVDYVGISVEQIKKLDHRYSPRCVKEYKIERNTVTLPQMDCTEK